MTLLMIPNIGYSGVDSSCSDTQVFTAQRCAVCVCICGKRQVMKVSLKIWSEEGLLMMRIGDDWTPKPPINLL